MNSKYNLTEGQIIRLANEFYQLGIIHSEKESFYSMNDLKIATLNHLEGLTDS